MGFKCSHKYRNKNTLFFILFLVAVIPTIIVYLEHSFVEFVAHDKSVIQGKETKAIKQLGEGILFAIIGIGYIVFTIWIFIQPRNKIPYVVILVGTVLVIVVYYLRIYGIPVVGTDIVITDISQDWRDVISKIAQQIMMIPLSFLLAFNLSNPRNKSSTT